MSELFNKSFIFLFAEKFQSLKKEYPPSFNKAAPMQNTPDNIIIPPWLRGLLRYFTARNAIVNPGISTNPIKV